MARRSSRSTRSKDPQASSDAVPGIADPSASNPSAENPSAEPAAATPGTDAAPVAAVEVDAGGVAPTASEVTSVPAPEVSGGEAVVGGGVDAVGVQSGEPELSVDGVPGGVASDAVGLEPAGERSGVLELGGGVDGMGEAEVVPVEAAGGGTGAGLQLKWILESLLFSAQKPMTPKELKDLLGVAAQDEEAPEAAAFKKTREDDIRRALEELQADHEAAARTYRLQCVAGTWQFASIPLFAPWLRALLGRKARPPKLSQPGIETLTIIAYRQPVTRAEIEQIRGVSVDGVMQTLLERGLVHAVGRAEVIGRPVTYGTTPLFLEYFGLRALEDLPSAEELRRLPVEKPESLSTVDPGLATAPADAPPPVVDLAVADAQAAAGSPPAGTAAGTPADAGPGAG